MFPRTSENEWLSFLKQYPHWTPPFIKTLVLSPHPDDEVLGLGGLIADLRSNHVPVTVIAVTDGENAYTGVANLASIRKEEQEQSLSLLDVANKDIIRLRLVDSAVQTSEARLEELILPYVDQNTHIIAPWTGDYHPDHEAVGRAAIKVARQTNATLSFYFFWTCHHATLSILEHLPLRVYELSEKVRSLKQDALNCYQSQLLYPVEQPILPKNLLSPALRSFEVFCHYEK